MKACWPASGGMPPKYIGELRRKKSLDPSLIMDLAKPLSTRKVKFFLMANSSAMWYCPSDTISKLKAIKIMYSRFILKEEMLRKKKK